MNKRTVLITVIYDIPWTTVVMVSNKNAKVNSVSTFFDNGVFKRSVTFLGQQVGPHDSLAPLRSASAADIRCCIFEVFS